MTVDYEFWRGTARIGGSGGGYRVCRIKSTVFLGTSTKDFPFHLFITARSYYEPTNITIWPDAIAGLGRGVRSGLGLNQHGGPQALTLWRDRGGWEMEGKRWPVAIAFL
jgi:hypothetical protein